MSPTINFSRVLSSFVCASCRQRILPSAQRAFSSSAKAPRDQGSSSEFNIGSILDADRNSLVTEEWARSWDASRANQPHKFHVYATKHNTHITFVQPPKPASETLSSGVGRSASASDQKKLVDVLLSMSTGNIGFRKAGRGSYDAAYQLAAFVLKQMQEKGMMRDVQKMEVVLRGYGAGREAVTKALLGSEGRNIRGRIISVTDATRLKQGGPRSKKPRRLG